MHVTVKTIYTGMQWQFRSWQGCTRTEAVTHAVKCKSTSVSGNNTPPKDISAPKSCNVLSDRCLAGFIDP